ncbi:MAG: hypothetical protein WC799_01665 [Desulfobacteraceae bacterium]|jgi:hypothetical protein
MSKRKKTKNKQKKSTQLPQLRKQSAIAVQKSYKLKALIAFFVAVIGILGSCATLYGLRPQPMVVSTVSLNEENPFDSQFSIINNGSLDMQDTRFICFLKNIETQVFSIHNGIAPIVKFQKISAGDTVTLPSFKAQLSASIIKGADIAIVVKYRPSFYPWRLKRVFRLVTLKAQPQGFKWVQQPVDEDFTKALEDAEIVHHDKILEGDWN